MHLFAPDCEDVLGRGVALFGVKFAFLRFPGLLSLCPDGFHRIAADFPLLPAASGRCSWLARLARLVVIFSTSYLFVLYLAKAGWEHELPASCLIRLSKLHGQAPCRARVGTGSKCYKKPFVRGSMYKHRPKLSAVQVSAKLVQDP